MKMASCMIHSRNIKVNLWAEAIHTTFFILNRTPAKAIMNITPEEAWSRRKPIVSHFCIFCCTTYSHIPDEKRSKLEGKSEKYIMVGYSEESNGYRLYNHNTREIHFKRNVWFDEDIESNKSPIFSAFPILNEEDKSISTNVLDQNMTSRPEGADI